MGGVGAQVEGVAEVDPGFGSESVQSIEGRGFRGALEEIESMTNGILEIRV